MLGVREVKLSRGFNSYGFLTDDDDEEEIRTSLSIIECHQDEVWEVPEGAQVIGCSEKTGVEMFRYGEKILGIQGHPEYTKDILDDIIDRLVSNNSIKRDFSEMAKLQVMEAELDTKIWGRICKDFLK